MSETDIYKSKEQNQPAPADPRFQKGRRRRSSSGHSFDKHDRIRRSKNSGLRRFIHLFRKSENEKMVWWGLLITIVTLLVFIAIWQFVYLDYVSRKQSAESDLYAPAAQSIPKADIAEDSAVE